jgi:glycine hydroxymethyltransferase
MQEIAAIVHLVLSNMRPASVEKDGETSLSKAKYELADGVKQEARSRVEALLDTFLLYPELDLVLLTEHFG